MCADTISRPARSVGGQDARANLPKIGATCLGRELGEPFAAGGLKFAHRMPCDEATIITIGEAFKHVQVVGRMRHMPGDPDIFRADFLRPLRRQRKLINRQARARSAEPELNLRSATGAEKTTCARGTITREDKLVRGANNII